MHMYFFGVSGSIITQYQQIMFKKQCKFHFESKNRYGGAIQ